MSYGKELIIDLYDCDVALFTKGGLWQYFVELAELTKMERCGDPHWFTMADLPPDAVDSPHLNGLYAVQFISTSNFTIHSLYDGRMDLNLFTCKDFDPEHVLDFTTNYFKGEVRNVEVVTRK